MTRADSDSPVFIVRRSGWALVMNLVLGLLLAALTVANFVYQIRTGGAWAIAIMFATIAAFFLWQAWTQFRERVPVLEIRPDGLRVPSASGRVIPWTHIWNVQPGGGLPGFAARRIDFQVDAETFTQLKLGQSFMGDVVVKRRGTPNAFSITTPQLDENASAILAAVRCYWPPDQRDRDGGE